MEHWVTLEVATRGHPWSVIWQGLYQQQPARLEWQVDTGTVTLYSHQFPAQRWQLEFKASGHQFPQVYRGTLVPLMLLVTPTTEVHVDRSDGGGSVLLGFRDTAIDGYTAPPGEALFVKVMLPTHRMVLLLRDSETGSYRQLESYTLQRTPLRCGPAEGTND